MILCANSLILLFLGLYMYDLRSTFSVSQGVEREEELYSSQNYLGFNKCSFKFKACIQNISQGAPLIRERIIDHLQLWYIWGIYTLCYILKKFLDALISTTVKISFIYDCYDTLNFTKFYSLPAVKYFLSVFSVLQNFINFKVS